MVKDDAWSIVNGAYEGIRERHEVTLSTVAYKEIVRVRSEGPTKMFFFSILQKGALQRGAPIEARKNRGAGAAVLVRGSEREAESTARQELYVYVAY